jgi:sterol desaturase/sphingolipid hydroxylase (fatty acid hydroxylase superfamily)
MDPVMIGIVVFFLAFLAYDTLRPARHYAKVKGWVPKGIASFLVYASLSTVLPFMWDAWLGQYRLVDATSLGTLRGGGVGFLSAQVFMYAWHRTMHANDFLWRWFHQMHHSAERVDVAGAFYFSPLDMVGWTFLGSLALVWAVGVTPQAAVLVNLALTFTAMFSHANIRTPQWLGHFGTYRNPETFEGEAGFYDGASARVGDMLLGRDVSIPRAGLRSYG